jgi:hypothetical protein
MESGPVPVYDPEFAAAVKFFSHENSKRTITKEYMTSFNK